MKCLLEDSNEKFLVFAHHQAVMNKIEEKIKEAKFPMVRMSRIAYFRYAGLMGDDALLDRDSSSRTAFVR